MAIQLLRGTTAQIASNSNTSVAGQPLYDMDKHILYIGDGQTAINKLEGIELGLNLNNGSNLGSLQQITFNDDAKNPKALGLGAIALGGFRGDKPDNQPDEDDTTVTAEGIQSFAQGCGSHAFGNWSIAMGKDNKAYQKASVSFNGSCIAGNKEGDPSDYSFAFAVGEATQAVGRASFSANDKTRALGLGSTSFGCNTKAQGDYTVVGGYGSVAASMGTNALGWYCKTGEASGNQLVGQTVLGIWNIPLSETGEGKALLIVGGGDGEAARKNSMVLQKSGRLTLSFSGTGYEDQDAVIWKSVKNNLGFTSKDSIGTSTSSATSNAYNSISSSGYGLAVGYANNLGSSQHSILVGYSNKMLGGYQTSAAIGKNLQVSASTQVVIGQFNDKRSDGAFVVGNGTSAEDLKNIMVLTNAGVLEVDRVQGVADEAVHATNADNATNATYATNAGNASNVTGSINGKYISNIFESNGLTAKNSTNVVSTINGHNISSIFEPDGTTVKKATNADEATHATSADKATTVSVTESTNINDYNVVFSNGDTLYQDSNALKYNSTDKMTTLPGGLTLGNDSLDHIYEYGREVVSSRVLFPIYDMYYRCMSNFISPTKITTETTYKMYNDGCLFINVCSDKGLLTVTLPNKFTTDAISCTWMTGRYYSESSMSGSTYYFELVYCDGLNIKSQTYATKSIVLSESLTILPPDNYACYVKTNYRTIT